MKSPSTYQAVVKVSESFRSIIRKNNDRVIISLFSCKVYDQVNVKRCNKCHNFGHWVKECDKRAACSICSEEHETKSYPQFKNLEFENKKCINCIRNGSLPNNHRADSSACPIYMKELAKCKEVLLNNLN